MGRIGSKGCAKIYGPDGDALPAYDNTDGYVANMQLDDQVKIRMPITNSPAEYKTHYGDLEKNIDSDITERLKFINNKTEYDIKVGKRQEGLMFAAAKDVSVVNLFQNYQPGGYNPMPLANFSRKEQMYLRGDMEMPAQTETLFDKGTQSLQKTQAPFEKDVQPTELEFIDEDGGEKYTSIIKRNVIDSSGSNVKADAYFDENGGRNQPVGDRTAESLYDQQMGYNTVSNVNIRQQNNFKARQQLGLYMGAPTTQKEKDNLFMQEFLAKDLAGRHVGGKIPEKKKPFRE